MHLKNNDMNNSQVIARGKAEYNFDCYKYNNFIIAVKCIRLPINHIALNTKLLSLRIAVCSN